jgi:KaiC/GvpD/RAD55 family RecA-like ATPase
MLLGPAGILAPRPPPVFLVDRIVRRGSVVFLIGYGGSGKTWLASAMLASIDAGVPWLGRFECKKGRAAYLDFEGGEIEQCRRIKSVMHGLELRTLENAFLGPMPHVFMGQPAFEAAITALAMENDLIIIDSLRPATSALYEENDASAREPIDVLRRVAEKTGCSFLIVHHAKKRAGNGADPREAGRGSSALFDAADSVLNVSSPNGEVIRVQHTKCRHASRVPPFVVQVRDTTTKVDGRVQQGVTVIAGDDETSPEEALDARLSEVRETVVDLLQRTPGTSTTELRKAIGVRGTTVDAVLKQLADEGMIENRGNHRTVWHLRSLEVEDLR